MLVRSKRLLFSFILLFSVLIATGCAGGTPEISGESDSPRYGGTLKANLSAPVQSLDPAHFYDAASMEVGKEVFNGLVTLDPKTMEVTSAHAERWEEKDGKIFKFYLSKGTNFHSGREVTAEDFKYSLERILDPATASEISGLLTSVKGASDKLSGKARDTAGIRVVEKYVLEIELSEINPNFLYILAHPGFSVVEKPAVDKTGKDFGTQAAKDNIIGTGPFKVSNWNNSQVELAANADYYGGKPYLEKVVYRFIKEETTALNEYKAGNLDIVDRLPPGQIQAIVKQYPNLTRKTDLLSVNMYLFNTKKPPFDNIDLRKAVNYAINREDIVMALEGQAVNGEGIIPKGMPGYESDTKGYGFDQAKALEHLEKAGYPNGQGLPPIELKFNPSEVNQRVAEIVQANLKDVGINVKLVSVEPAVYLEDLASGNSQIFRISWVADYPDVETFLYPIFHSAEIGHANFGFYNNPQFDALMNEARTTADKKLRAELYDKAHEKLMEDSVGAVLYYSAHINLISPRVRDLYISKMDTKPLSKVWLAE